MTEALVDSATFEAKSKNKISIYSNVFVATFTVCSGLSDKHSELVQETSVLCETFACDKVKEVSTN